MENVIIKFVADTEGLQPAIKQLELLGKITADDAVKFNQINQEQKEFIQGLNKSTTEMGKLSSEVEGLMAEIQAGVMEGFADHLAEVTKETTQSAKGFKSMKAELRELKAQISSGSLGAKELKEATKRAAELQDTIGDVNDKVKALASDTKRIDAMVTAFRGLAGVVSVGAGAMSVFGAENENLTKTLAKAQGAMALLQGVQELANIATTEGALKTYILDGAQKAAAVSSRVLGVTITASMAMATAGISLLVAGLVYLVATMDETEESATNMNKSLEMDAESRFKNIEKMNKFIGDSLDKRLRISRQAYQQELNELEKQFKDGKLSSEAYHDALLNGDELFFREQQQIRDDWAKEEADKDKKQRDEKLKRLKEAYDAEAKLLQEWRNKRQQMMEKMKQASIDMEMAEVEDKINSRMRDDADFDKRNLDRMAKQQAANDAELASLMKLLNQTAAARKVSQLEWTKFALDQAQVVSDTIFTINQQNRQAEVDSQLDMLNQMRDNELSNKSLTDAQKAKLELRYQREEARIKQAAWESEKAAAIAQAIINTALAVTKAWATVPPPANIPAAIAAGVAGAAQVAVISNTKPPKFEKGGVVGGELHSNGGTIIEAERGEYVINRHSTADYLPAITAINNGDIEPTLANNILSALADGTFGMAQWQPNEQPILDYYRLAQIVERGKSTVNINLDENGFNKSITKAGSTVNIKNRKFRATA